MMSWLCVLVGTVVLGVGGYGAFKAFGHLAMKRDEAERERLAEEWKRRAAERKAKHTGAAPPATPATPPAAANEQAPPMY